MDEWKWKRTPAVLITGLIAFLVGVPAALSYSLLKEQTFFGMQILDFMSFVATSIMIPLGGLLAIILVGWHWGAAKAIAQLKEGAAQIFERKPWLSRYFLFVFKYSAPILIILVLLNEILAQFMAFLTSSA
jgi:NSS family neurotransmitter:Na+ symporter